jgi:hypothetical protein
MSLSHSGSAAVGIPALATHGIVATGRRRTETPGHLASQSDQAAEHFERHTGSNWRPRSGSMVNHRNLTSAMIDSRDFLAAKKRADNEVLLPAGPKIAFTGGLDFNDHRLIWAKLDQVHAKHPDMVLLHGKSPKGAEKIAAKWADARKVPQVGFAPDWTKHAKAAPFKRNDAMLDVLPIGVIVFPSTGIQDNLADKARKLGIPLRLPPEGRRRVGAALSKPSPAEVDLTSDIHRLSCNTTGRTLNTKKPRKVLGFFATVYLPFSLCLPMCRPCQ